MPSISQIWSNPFGRIGLGLISGGIVGATGGSISGYGFDSTTMIVPIPPASIVISSSIAGSIFGATTCLLGPSFLENSSCAITAVKCMAFAAGYFGGEAIGWITTQKIGYDVSFDGSMVNSAMGLLLGLTVVVISTVSVAAITLCCCIEKESDLEIPLRQQESILPTT